MKEEEEELPEPKSPILASDDSRESDLRVDSSSLSDDMSSTSSHSPSPVDSSEERPRLSFGISQILANTSSSKKRSNINRGEEDEGSRRYIATPGSGLAYITAAAAAAASYSNIFGGGIGGGGITFKIPCSSGS